MPHAVQKLYEMQGGDQLTKEECAQINRELSELEPSKVPPDQADNVVSYLDRQFLFSQVDPAIAERLEQLIRALRGYD